MKCIASILTIVTYSLASFAAAGDSVVNEISEPEVSATASDLASLLDAEESQVVGESAAATVSDIAGVDVPVANEPEVELGILPDDGTLTNTPAVVAAAEEQSVLSDGGAPASKLLGKKKSFFDKFKVQSRKKTCEEAMATVMNAKNVILDFSDTSDFPVNGDAAMSACYARIIETKSFGTHSQNLLVNLSKTGVTSDFIVKWSAIFQRDKRTVLWNLSENSSVDDSIIDALAQAFHTIYSINLAYTNITDAGIDKIIAMLENGTWKLVCITITGSKVSASKVAELRLALQKNVELWKAKNPGKEYLLEGDSGVIYKKSPFIASVRKRKKPTPNFELQAPVKIQAPVTLDTIGQFSTEPVVDSDSTIDTLSDATAQPEEAATPVATVLPDPTDFTIDIPSDAAAQPGEVTQDLIQKTLRDADEIIAKNPAPVAN
ncbi:MAG: hypothetical protein LBB34_01120 [Holosporales bacterium]|jgi:hypothetical protein|nr:hypothetical protein [Holosporales bacterium]